MVSSGAINNCDSVMARCLVTESSNGCRTHMDSKIIGNRRRVQNYWNERNLKLVLFREVQI